MKIKNDEWLKAQQFEKAWWSSAKNTCGEESKQLVYGKKMGLDMRFNGFDKWVDVHNQSICDIGGGVTSLLLKARNLAFGLVVEPMKLPSWAYMRYLDANINLLTQPAETVKLDGVFDEIWIYNVLQHTQDPKKIVENAKKHAKLIRMFEWLDTPPHDGHPQTLREDELNKWLGGNGRTEILDSDLWNGYNKAYYGVFPTEHYNGKLNQ
jgi:2-polyprenyl-3-methyl-5-hydroxy-6-metoxy-1,4-benzoquinol methylase